MPVCTLGRSLRTTLMNRSRCAFKFLNEGSVNVIKYCELQVLSLHWISHFG